MDNTKQNDKCKENGYGEYFKKANRDENYQPNATHLTSMHDEETLIPPVRLQQSLKPHYNIYSEIVTPTDSKNLK